jgi:hypothetical protein
MVAIVSPLLHEYETAGVEEMVTLELHTVVAPVAEITGTIGVFTNTPTGIVVPVHPLVSVPITE